MCRIFQPTHPLRGATRWLRMLMRVNLFQPTHPLRGATVDINLFLRGFTISTHAPLAGCDLETAPFELTIEDFNPRTPCGVRLWIRANMTNSLAFQPTHPLRGATRYVLGARKVMIYFNPRTPCGVRRQYEGEFRGDYEFQPTHPLRGATQEALTAETTACISTHAPLAGCDVRADGA